MKPPPLRYHAPASLEEALELLGQTGSDAKVLAGGQSLLPMLNYRLAAPTDVVDICRIPGLDVVEASEGALRIGAAARQRDVENDPAVARGWPLLVEALGLVGHPQIRNRGTVCGSLAHADPAAELPAAMVALDAEMVIRSSAGSRRVPADEFFRFHFTTAVDEGELLEEVVVPGPSGPQACSYQEISTRPGDFAIAGVAVTLGLARDGSVRTARLVCAGTAPRPQRLREAERELVGTRPGPAETERIAEIVHAGVEPRGDAHASQGYRRRACSVLARRGVQRALGLPRAGDGRA